MPLIAVQVSEAGLYEDPFPRTESPVPSPPQTIISPLPATAVWKRLAAGHAPEVEVAEIQISLAGLYLPPVLSGTSPAADPPQTTISPEMNTAVANCLTSGHGPSVDTADQMSVAGSYLPPSLRRTSDVSEPDQTIISVPLQTAVWFFLAEGHGADSDVGVQESAAGLYRPPF